MTERNNKWLKTTNIAGVLMIVYFSIGSIFNHEIVKAGCYVYYAICGFIIIAVAIICAIMYYVTKNK